MAENATVNNAETRVAPQNGNDTSTPEEENVRVDRVPWSELAQEFAETWGRADPKDPQPEHVEVIGINVRHTPCVFLQSKPADATVEALGWPIIADGDVRRALKERWSVYWPLTNATGRDRKLYQANLFRDLLNALWHKDANTIVVFDDFGYIQELFTSDGEALAPIVQMYLREGRSSGITDLLVKQRPQGSRREMHSETQWTVAFKPKDEDDMERWAQLFGNKKAFTPIIKSMDDEKHEFLIKHFKSGATFISWVDTPLRPIQRPKQDAKVRPLPNRYTRLGIDKGLQCVTLRVRPHPRKAVK
jgi:hypothetical protein